MPTAQDFVFCEVYESNLLTYDHIHDGFAAQIVRLEDCDLAGFPENVTIPLDLPISLATITGALVRGSLFALVDGALGADGRHWSLDGVHDDRWQNWTLRIARRRFGQNLDQR